MSDISISKVVKTYGKNQVVHGIDLDIANGEFIVILGPSGCGKSTLLRMVAGLEDITSGEIAIAGRVVNRLEPRERGCAMVFQNYALYPHMTVAENIGYSLKVAGIAKAERVKRVQAVAETLALGEFLERKPGQLSGGQRQRVAMGRAMIREPKVFLYDEPLSNLDAKLRVAMRAEIRKLHQRLGATSIFVTHDQVEAMTLADRIVVMNKGTIDQIGTPREIYHRPATTYVAGFIGSPGMNLLPGRVEAGAQRLVLGDGQWLPLDMRRYGHLGEGEVTIGIRAEAIRVSDDPQAIAVSFDFTEELGSAQLVHSEVAGQSIVAECSEARAYAPRSVLRYQIAGADIHLFDKATGHRLPERGEISGGAAVAGPIDTHAPGMLLANR